MVENIISQFKNNSIKTKESLILQLAKELSYHIDSLYEKVKEFNIDKNFINNVIDAYYILQKGSKTDSKLKELLDNSNFIDSNNSILFDLSKIYFYCDSICLIDNEIIINKSIINNVQQEESEPIINIEKTIYTALQKIKYNRMDNNSINKLGELSKYSSYKKLYKILMLAIENENKIKLLEDDECNLKLEKLEEYLNS